MTNNRRLIAVFAGGATGAALRWAIIEGVSSKNHMWVILLINLVGCFLLGIFVAQEWNHPRKRIWLQDFGGVGFCGGFTTFSAISVDFVEYFQSARSAVAFIMLFGNIIGGIVAVALGAFVMHRMRALLLPLEEGDAQ